jgi:hypothetical protein
MTSDCSRLPPLAQSFDRLADEFFSLGAFAHGQESLGHVFGGAEPLCILFREELSGSPPCLLGRA